MTRFWLGAAILAVLLGLGIGITVAVDRFCDPISADLSRAAAVVQQNRWEQAQKLSDGAQQRWQKHRALHAAVSNHEPMEQIDALFEQLKIYSRAGDSLRFAECCAQLASLTAALGESRRRRTSEPSSRARSASTSRTARLSF